MPEEIRIGDFVAGFSATASFGASGIGFLGCRIRLRLQRSCLFRAPAC